MAGSAPAQHVPPPSVDPRERTATIPPRSAGPAATTLAATSVTAVVALLAAAAGGRSVVRWAGGGVGVDQRAQAGSLGLTLGGGGDVDVVVAVLAGGPLLTVAAVVGVCALGLARRREWARQAAVGVHAALGGVLLPLSVAGAVGGARTAPVGILVSVVCLVAVGLLVRDATVDDVYLAEQRRARRR